MILHRMRYGLPLEARRVLRFSVVPAARSNVCDGSDSDIRQGVPRCPFLAIFRRSRSRTPRQALFQRRRFEGGVAAGRGLCEHERRCAGRRKQHEHKEAVINGPLVPRIED